MKTQNEDKIQLNKLETHKVKQWWKRVKQNYKQQEKNKKEVQQNEEENQ